jgi:hypothetical protein
MLRLPAYNAITIPQFHADLAIDAEKCRFLLSIDEHNDGGRVANNQRAMG